MLLTEEEIKVIRALLTTGNQEAPWYEMADSELTAWGALYGITDPKGFLEKCHRLGIGKDA